MESDYLTALSATFILVASAAESPPGHRAGALTGAIA